MNWRGFSVIACGIACLWATLTFSGLSSLLSFTEKAEIDRGTHFRLKVDFAYKGEPQHFDIVVGCNALNIRYKDGSQTREVGMMPTVYGRPMSDGKAVVVRPPDACRGDTTANGGVPDNFLPVMIVYDDAKTVAFGTGYMTDEAYENPRSVMKFGKASIESASRQEFDAFRENGAANVVTRSQYHSVQSEKHLADYGLVRTHPAFGWHCYAYARWKLDEEGRQIVRKYRPAGSGKYWTISNVQKRVAFEKEFYGALRKLGTRIRDDGLKLKIREGFKQADFGGLRRDGVKLVGLDSFERAQSIYPGDSSISEDKWPSSANEVAAAYAALKSINVVNVEVAGGGTRGFAYCYATEWPPKRFESVVNAATATTTVEDIPVDGAPQRWRRPPDEGSPIFEDDEYLFENHLFYLESTRGDV